MNENEVGIVFEIAMITGICLSIIVILYYLFFRGMWINLLDEKNKELLNAFVGEISCDDFILNARERIVTIKDEAGDVTIPADIIKLKYNKQLNYYGVKFVADDKDNRKRYKGKVFQYSLAGSSYSSVLFKTINY